MLVIEAPGVQYLDQYASSVTSFLIKGVLTQIGMYNTQITYRWHPQINI